MVAKDADGDKIIYRAIRLAGAPFVVVPQTGEVVLTEKPNQRMYLIQVYLIILPNPVILAYHWAVKMYTCLSLVI